VDRVVREMPLWKLQTVGNAPLEFLYENWGHGTSIELKPGVMFCLRRFHELVTDLVRGAWLRYVRRFNGQVLGAPNDLDQFLFGAERAPLEKYLPILREVQEGRCLYCEKEVEPRAAHIDHFIPWSRYPVDLGHNFVLAHAGCNGAKADHLAAGVHLGRWVERNRTAASFLQKRFDQGLIVHSVQSSERIARWAYSQAAATHALAWVKSREFQAVDAACVHLLSERSNSRDVRIPLAPSNFTPPLGAFRKEAGECQQSRADAHKDQPLQPSRNLVPPLQRLNHQRRRFHGFFHGRLLHFRARLRPCAKMLFLCDLFQLHEAGDVVAGRSFIGMRDARSMHSREAVFHEQIREPTAVRFDHRIIPRELA
jgi:hypothetical protein